MTVNIYSIRTDEVDSSNTYIGIAAPASVETDLVWQIKKIVVSGAITKVFFASGTKLFDKSWTLRATYIYS